MRLVAKLQQIRSSDRNIDAIYFMSRRENGEYVYVDPDLSYWYDEYKQELTDIFHRSDSSLETLPVRSFGSATQESRVLSGIVLRLPFDSMVKTGMILIDIDLSFLMANIVGNDADDLLLVDAAGNVLLPKAQQGKRLDALFPGIGPVDGMSGANAFRSGGKRMVQMHIQAKDPGLTFVRIAPYGELMASELLIRKVIIVGNIVLFLVYVAIAHFLSLYMHRPVKQMMAAVKGLLFSGAPEEKRVTMHDELERIKTGIHKMLKENKHLQVTYNKFMPQLKERYYYNLLHGKYETINLVQEQASLLQLNADTEDFGLIVMEIDFLQQHTMQDKHAKRLLFLDKSEHFWAEHQGKMMVEVAEDRWAVVLREQNEFDNREFNRYAYALCKNLRDQAEETIGISVSFGIGKCNGGPLDLHPCFKQVGELLRYKISLGHGMIMTLQENSDIPQPEKRELFLVDENKLSAMIVMGNKADITAYLDEFFTSLPQYHSPAAMQEQMIHVLHILLQTLDRIGKQAFFGERQLYQELIAIKNLALCKEWMLTAFLSVADYYRGQIEAEETRWVQQILKYVETEFHQTEMSMTMISEAFNLSPTYIGRVFKKERGVSLMDYVCTLRLERAKTMLASPELKIYEVAEAVGFQTNHYFIKLFKEKTGLTPGDYRKFLIRDRTN